MTESAWHLGLVNADGSGFRLVKNAELKPDAFGAPEWARDGKSIFCHDLDNIYQIDLDAKVLKKWELAKILTDASMNGGDWLSVSPDGKALLMDVDCGAEHERKDWDGPQPAVERLDFTADKAVRVTGKDDYVWEPFWLSASEFLCIMQKQRKNSRRFIGWRWTAKILSCSWNTRERRAQPRRSTGILPVGQPGVSPG
jgi:TolB protein